MKKVFIMAGQSNMAGRGCLKDLPAHLQVPDPAIGYHYAIGFARDGGEPQLSPGWIPLQPGPEFPSTDGPQFGPELTFAETLKARRIPEIHIIKVAIGGTNLAEDWNPDARSGKQIYPLMMKRCREAIEALQDSGDSVELAALLWMQGEGDATDEHFAEAYRKHFRDFIARIRKDFNTPELPFITGQIVDRTNPLMKWAKTVRAAQTQVVETVPNTRIVLTDDLPDLGDGTHFNSSGLMELGRRFAEAFFKLEAS